jgi:hypothetical protein
LLAATVTVRWINRRLYQWTLILLSRDADVKTVAPVTLAAGLSGMPAARALWKSAASVELPTVAALARVRTAVSLRVPKCSPDQRYVPIA